MMHAPKPLQDAAFGHSRGIARRALVGFGDATRPRWLKLLTCGFRHCLVAIEHGGRWVVCDPRSHWTAIAVLPPMREPDIARHLADAGYLVVPARARAPEPIAQPWRPYTCVEAVKRALGLRAPWVLTPRQLFRRLTTEFDRM